MSDEEKKNKIKNYEFKAGNIYKRYNEAGHSLSGSVREEESYMPIIYTIIAIPFFSLIAFGALAFGYHMLGFGNPLTPTIIESNWYVIAGVVYLIVTHFCYKDLLQKVADQNASLYFDRGVNAVLTQLEEAQENLTKKEFAELFKEKIRGYLPLPLKED